MTRPVRARISLPALQHNLRCARAAAPQSRVMAVVKADGYGHGMVAVAKALSAADGYAVARVSEAMILREAGIRAPITLLEGFIDEADLEEADCRKLEVVLHSEAQLTLLEAACLEHPLRVWVKIDTGMHRLGFAVAAVDDVVMRLEALPFVKKPLGFLSHLACADDVNAPNTRHQREQFESTVSKHVGEKSLANSAAVLRWPDTHYDWVRPGIMLYGVSPFIGGRGSDYDLQPVMSLETQLIAVNALHKGDAVGYGADWICPQDMRVGVVAIGYGDGYPRHARSGTPVLVNGRRAPLAGRVSMDMITVDLREHPDAAVGDPVLLWGEGLPVEEVAQAAGTIAYELLTGVTARVQREV